LYLTEPGERREYYCGIHKERGKDIGTGDAFARLHQKSKLRATAAAGQLATSV
jgi:hypothetical protein